MARLAVNVVLRDPQSGEPRVFEQGSELPEWAEVDDHVFEGSDVPPKAGKGSGRDAWAAYAADRGVDVDEDASREDIVAALDAAGVPTE